MPLDPRFASGLALALLGAIAGVGFGIVQQHRTVVRLEARHREDLAAQAERIDEVRRMVDAVRSEIADAREAGSREDHRLGALVHDLDDRLEQLRLVAEPMIAEAPEAPIVAQ